MNLKNKDIQKLFLVFLPLIIILLGLIFSNGPLFIFFTLALWIWFSIMIIFSISLFFEIIIQRLLKPLDERLSNTNFGSKFQLSEKNQRRINKFNSWFLPTVIGALLSIYVLTAHMAVITHWKAEQNVYEFEDFVSEITEGKESNISKTKAILKWFDIEAGNIYNNWRLRESYLFALDSGRIQFYTTYPFIGVRTYNDNDVLWILSSQFGHCGEYSNLFRAMAYEAGLSVRKVCTEGENHCWNEVYINETIGWKVVDPTSVSLDGGNNGYDNVNRSFMRSRLGGNLSYVEAKEKNGSSYNVTFEYTAEVNITVTTVNKNDEIVPGATVKLYSNNRYAGGRYTNLKGVTNSKGNYTFTVGIGNYTFKASKDDLSGKNSSVFSNEKLNHEIKLFVY